MAVLHCSCPQALPEVTSENTIPVAVLERFPKAGLTACEWGFSFPLKQHFQEKQEGGARGLE